MDPKIELTSAAEASEIELTSAVEGPEIEVTSAAEAPEIELTSAAEASEIELTSAAEGPEIELTSATEAPEIELTSAAEGPEIELTSAAEGPEIELTSAAEGPEIELTSAAEGPEIELTSATEAPEIELTSAAEGPEIELTSAAEGPEVGGTSAAEGPNVRRYWKYDSTSSSDSIFRAPAHIRYGRESDFEPKWVSIGPYHRGRPNLQPMEKTKFWCMSNLLTMRPGDPDKGEHGELFYNRGGSNMDRVSLGPFMKFESRARSFYKEKFDQISAVEFVGMLILDSCFVIRILLTHDGAIAESMGSLEVNMKEVRSDLLLLENQIPLFFIHVVYYWLFPNTSRGLFIFLYWFITRDLPWQFSSNSTDFESDHLLDFYWKSSVPETEQLIEIMKRHKRQQTPSWEDIPCRLQKLIANATELHQIAGIKFQSDYYLDGLQVEFSKGIMRMHCLKIDSSLAISLLNLIALENTMQTSLRFITTYIKFLDDFIDSDKDVELLQKFGVIYNTRSSHTTAAIFFNEIGNLCVIDKNNNPFSDLFRNVDKYYKSSWNRRWASLQNNYFNSPWAGISVFAGVLLLFLAAVQTYYTVFPRN